RALEFHGHEWLAYAEAGIPTVDATEIGRPPRAPSYEAERPGWRDRMREMLGRQPRDEAVGEEHAGHHRRSDLVFRIAPGNRPNRGDHVALTVDLGRVLFFGADGRRATPVQR